MAVMEDTVATAAMAAATTITAMGVAMTTTRAMRAMGKLRDVEATRVATSHTDHVVQVKSNLRKPWSDNSEHMGPLGFFLWSWLKIWTREAPFVQIK